jgi:hypothetical protein
MPIVPTGVQIKKNTHKMLFLTQLAISISDKNMAIALKLPSTSKIEEVYITPDVLLQPKLYNVAPAIILITNKQLTANKFP